MSSRTSRVDPTSTLRSLEATEAHCVCWGAERSEGILGTRCVLNSIASRYFRHGALDGVGGRAMSAVIASHQTWNEMYLLTLETRVSTCSSGMEVVVPVACGMAGVEPLVGSWDVDNSMLTLPSVQVETLPPVPFSSLVLHPVPAGMACRFPSRCSCKCASFASMRSSRVLGLTNSQ